MFSTTPPSTRPFAPALRRATTRFDGSGGILMASVLARRIALFVPCGEAEKLAQRHRTTGPNGTATWHPPTALAATGFGNGASNGRHVAHVIVRQLVVRHPG